jgi:Zn-dependent protease
VQYIIIRIAIYAFPILVAVILHEVAHGYAASRLGDPTARNAGRLTLNPLPHIDPMGTLLIPGLLIMLKSSFIFGWAKPVPINPYYFKNPRRDLAISAAAGPATNLGLAFIGILLFNGISLIFGPNSPDFISGIINPLRLILYAFIAINMVLAILNMIPVPPLDGGRVLAALLPEDKARKLDKIEPYGMFIVIGLFVFGLIDFIFWPVGFVLHNLLV